MHHVICFDCCGTVLNVQPIMLDRTPTYNLYTKRLRTRCTETLFTRSDMVYKC